MPTASRKRSRTARTARPARPARRVMRKASVRAPPRTAQLSYVRKFYGGNWQPNTATTTGFWQQYNLSLGSLPNVSEFVNLFDQYKINAIKLQFMPRYSNFDGANTTDTTLPGITNQNGNNLHVCYDIQSTTDRVGAYGPATLNAFMEQGRIKSYTGVKPVVIYYKPCIVTENVAKKFKGPAWLPTLDTSVQHIGPQIFHQDSSMTGTFGQSYDIFITMYCQFKNTK